MNSDLHNKLSQFEVTPPAGVWDKIADALDADLKFPQRLYQYEETPPAQTWKMIEAGLDEATGAKVIPFTTKFRKPIRYLAAASFIAVVLITTTLLMKRTEAGSVPTESEATVPVKETPVITPDKTIVFQPADILPDPQAHIVQTTKVDEIYASGTKTKRSSGFIIPQNPFESVAVAGRFIPTGIDENEMFDNSFLNNFMVYSDGEGNAMKLPKKLFNLVHCQDGDDTCKERIHHLQQILSSNATNSDFIGMVEMLRKLQ